MSEEGVPGSASGLPAGGVGRGDHGSQKGVPLAPEPGGSVPGRPVGRGLDPPPRLVRLAVGLGAPEREDVLVPTLTQPGGPLPVVFVVQRYLSADEVLEGVRQGRVDAIVIAFDLHRLTRDRLAELRRLHLPTVLLTPPSPASRGSSPTEGGNAAPISPGIDWVGRQFSGAPDASIKQDEADTLVPLDAPAGEVLQALLQAVRLAPPAARPRPGAPRPSLAVTETRPGNGENSETTPPPVSAGHSDGVISGATSGLVAEAGEGAATRATTSARPRAASEGRSDRRARPQARRGQRGMPAATANGTAALTSIAVVGGAGSPGCSTVALSLATALGAVAPTVCVDASRTPSIAAYIDADPTRSLYMLAHANPETPREWDRALRQELQPLDRRSPQGVLLAGVPKPEMWRGVTGTFMVRLLAELRQRFRYVVLDVGHRPVDGDAGPWGAVVHDADQVLFVTASDLVSIWRARIALRSLLNGERPTGGPDGPSGGVVLLLNRHDRRIHHRRSEVEWTLEVPSAAVVPYDHGGTERAIAAQRPLALDPRSRAGRAVVDLAERIHGGRVVLPPEIEGDAGSGLTGRVRKAGATGSAAWSSGWTRFAAGLSGMATHLAASRHWSRRPRHPSPSAPSVASPSTEGAGSDPTRSDPARAIGREGSAEANAMPGDRTAADGRLLGTSTEGAEEVVEEGIEGAAEDVTVGPSPSVGQRAMASEAPAFGGVGPGGAVIR